MIKKIFLMIALTYLSTSYIWCTPDHDEDLGTDGQITTRTSIDETPAYIHGILIAENYALGDPALLIDKDPEHYGFIKIEPENYSTLVNGEKVIVRRGTGEYTYGLMYYLDYLTIIVDIQENKQSGMRKLRCKPMRHDKYPGSIAPVYIHPSWKDENAIDQKKLAEISELLAQNSANNS